MEKTLSLKMGAGAGTRRSAWSWVVAGALAAVLLYFSLRGIEWRRVWEATVHARWRYLALSALITTFTYFLRSLRWRLLLNAKGAFGVGTVFWANMAGYLGNNFLPARAGEFVRSYLVSERSSLTKAYVLTTALTERLLDAVTLVLCGSLVLLRVEQKPAWMGDASRSIAVVALLGVAAIAALPSLEGFAGRLLRRLPLPPGLRQRLLSLIEQVALGLRAFHHAPRLAGFVALTAVVWSLDTWGVTIGARALDLHVSFSLGLLLIVGLGLSSALPSTPGYVGIYQFVAISVLTPFGIDRNAALAYIILTQAAAYVLVLTLGSLGLYRLRRPSGSR